ncbi:MAG: hypothetical protein ACR2RV_01665 [Verrucomicrobiales bacterium]
MSLLQEESRPANQEEVLLSLWEEDSNKNVVVKVGVENLSAIHALEVIPGLMVGGEAEISEH